MKGLCTLIFKSSTWIMHAVNLQHKFQAKMLSHHVKRLIRKCGKGDNRWETIPHTCVLEFSVGASKQAV